MSTNSEGPEVRPRPAPRNPEAGDRFRALLHRKNLTAPELAQRAGVAAATVYRCVAGETIPNDETLDKLAGPLGLTPGGLLDVILGRAS